MDAPQNSGKDQNGQNNEKKTQLSWSQPLTSPSKGQLKPAQSSSAAIGDNSVQHQSHAMRNLVIAAVAILVIAGVAWAITGRKGSPTETNTASSPNSATPATTANPSGAAVSAGTSSATQTQASFPSGALVLPSPQNAGLEVAVANIEVKVPTWVVIYENYNGQPGNVLGAALFTKDRTSGAIDLLRGTLPGQTYYAGEARDDGDHMFSMVGDPAIRDTGGNPITLKFQTK